VSAKQRVAVAIGFFCCAFFTTIIALNYIHFSKFGNDFGVYWRSANVPLADVYSPEDTFPFPYMPTMLVWITPLDLVGKSVGYLVWLTVSIAAFVVVIRRYLPKLGIALTLVSPPVARGLFTGQVCAALAALSIWACRTANRTGAGVAFGVIASVKPQLVAMAPLMMLLNRDWRALRASVVTFCLAVLLSLVLFGPALWLDWLRSLQHFHQEVLDLYILPVATSPAAVAERFGYPPSVFLAVGTCVGAGVVYLCRDAEPLEKAAAITVGSIMASPYALVYDLTAVMPFLALGVSSGRILPAIGMAIPFHPTTLAISAIELVSDKSTDRVEGRRRVRV
jgi:hypothetical protein